MAALIPAMGAAGTLMGGAGALLGGISGGKGKSSGGQRPPDWLANEVKRATEMGGQIAQQPYQAYTGNRVAGFSPDTMAAFDMIRNNVGAVSPAYQSALGTAQGLTSFNAPTTNGIEASQWAGQSLDPYMNPYIQNVINAQQADAQNAYGQSYNQLMSQAAGAKAFGGSRFGVAQGQLAADSVRNQALISAQLRSQGFDTAAGLLSQDVASQNWAKGMNLQNDQFNAGNAIQSAQLRGNAANSLGALAGQYQQSMGQDAQSMAQAGSAQEAKNQLGLDTQYNDFIDKTRGFPAWQLQMLQQSVQPGLTQYAIRNQTPTQTSGGGLVGALGGAALGAQAGQALGNWWSGLNTPIGLNSSQLNDAYSQINALNINGSLGSW